MVLRAGRRHEHRQCTGVLDWRLDDAAPDACAGPGASDGGWRCAGQRVHGLERVFYCGVAPVVAAPVGRCGQCLGVHCRGSLGCAAGCLATRAQRSVAGLVLRWHGLWHCGVGFAGACRVAGGRWTSPWLGLGVVGLGAGLCGRHWRVAMARQGAAGARAAFGAGHRCSCQFSLWLACVCAVLGRVYLVWGGLHRLHDLCDCAAARARGQPRCGDACFMPCWAWR
jgi:hypothetical protein